MRAQISANTSVKTIEGHYTGHFKAMVTKPQNVLVLRDVMAAGYRMGGGTKFFGATPGNPNITLDEVGIKLGERLMSADDMVYAEYPSLLAFPMHSAQYELGAMDTVMSITTRLLPWETSAGANAGHKSFPGGEAVFQAYNNKIGLRKVHFGEDLRAAENMDYCDVAKAPTPARYIVLSSDLAKPRVSAIDTRANSDAGEHQQRHLLRWPAPQVERE